MFPRYIFEGLTMKTSKQRDDSGNNKRRKNRSISGDCQIDSKRDAIW